MTSSPGFVIIGNCAAGIAAAEAIREMDQDTAVTIISDEPHPAYGRPLTTYIIGGKVTEDQMWMRPANYYQKMGISTMLGKRVTAVNADEKFVVLHTGRKVGYDKLLIATGGSPKKLGVPGDDLEGVFTLRTLDDSRAIIGCLPRTSRVVLSGGGLVSTKSMEAFHSLKMPMSMVISSPNVLSQTLDPELAQLMRKHFENNGVDVRTEDSIEEVLGKDGQVTGVRLKSGDTIACEMVIVGKGVSPNTGLARDSGIEVDWGIVVDRHQCTTAPDVYSAGDVAQVPSFYGGPSSTVAIWPAAYEQGRVAGGNMAGRRTAYPGGIGMNSAEFFGLPVISAGITRVRQEGLKVHEYKRGKTYRRLITRDGVLVGSILIGDVTYAGVLTAMIKSRRDITDIEDELLRGDFAAFVADRDRMVPASMAHYSEEEPFDDPAVVSTR